MENKRINWIKIGIEVLAVFVVRNQIMVQALVITLIPYVKVSEVIMMVRTYQKILKN